MEELYSGLQKGIRRNDLKLSLFCAGEFINSGNPMPLWNRLFLIAIEDVSIGSPNYSITLLDNYNKWLNELSLAGLKPKFSYKSVKATSYLFDSVVYLTSCHKSRIINNSLCYITCKYSFSDIIIPIDKLYSLPDKVDINFIGNGLIKHLYCLLYFYIKNNVYEKAINCADIINQINEVNKSNNYSIINYLITINVKSELIPLFNVLKIINDKDFGSVRLIITFMIYLIINFDDIIFDGVNKIIPSDEYSSYFYNSKSDESIIDGRLITIPLCALDKHTSRGKGSKKTSDTYHLLEKEAKKRGIDISSWSIEEKNKSHGAHIKFANNVKELKEPINTLTESSLHSRISHFFFVGSYVTPILPNQVDSYLYLAFSVYAEIESSKGWRAAKSTQVLQLRLNNIKMLMKTYIIPKIKIGLKVMNNVPAHKIKIGLKSQPKLELKMKPPIKLELKMKSLTKVDNLNKHNEENEIKLLTFNHTVWPTCLYPTKDMNMPVLGYESVIFSNKVFANVSNKTATFYAIINNCNVLVKGPYLKNNLYNLLYQCAVDYLKPLFGLNQLGMHIANIIRDNDNNVGHYLIMKDIGPGVNKYPTKVVNPKFGGSFIKMDKENMSGLVEQFVVWYKKNDIVTLPDTMKQYVDVVLYRSIIKSSDTNLTNIIINHNNKVFSVDENYKSDLVIGDMFSHKHSKKWANMMCTYFTDNKDMILLKLKNWKLISQNISSIDSLFNVNVGSEISGNIDALINIIENNKWIFKSC